MDESRLQTTLPDPQPAPRAALIAYYAIAIAIALLLSLPYLIKHHAFAFVDIGSDTFFQFLPLQIAEVRTLHEWHLPSWSFEIGPGAYLGFTLDPIQTLGAFFPESMQLALRLPLYLLKLVLGGAFFFGYLRLLFGSRFALFGALAYAFSGYAMTNGQWDGHGYEVFQFAAFLFFLEGFLRKLTPWRAIAAGVVVGSGHIFNLYTFALFSCLYAAVHLCLSEPGQRRAAFARLLHAGLLMLGGVLLMAPLQAPNLYYLLENPRVSGSYSAASQLLGSIAQLNNRQVIGAEIAGFLGKDLLGAGTAYVGWGNYLEGPGFYVGILLLLCLPQLLGPGAPRERRVCLAGIGLIFLYVVWPGLRLLVNGFGFSTFRISTLWMSYVILLLGLMGLRRMLAHGPWRPGIVIAGCGLVGTACLVAWRVPQGVDVRQLACVLAFVASYCALLWHASGEGRRIDAASCTALLGLFCLELLLFALPSMLERTPVNADGTSAYGSYQDGTAAALDLIRKNDRRRDFFRIEKSYNSVFLCDALAQDYAGIKSYSFHASSLTRFVDRTGIERIVPSSANYVGSALNRRDLLDVLGVDYLLAHGRELDAYPGVEFVYAAGNIGVYRNTRSLGFAHLHAALLSEADADRLAQDQRNAAMRSSVIVSDPAELQRKLAAMPAAADRDGAAQGVRIHRNNDADLDGEVNSPQASVLLLSIPFDRGWKVWLDDLETQTFVADYGLTGVLVPPGEHALRLRYAAPWSSQGLGVALCALLALGAYFALGRRRRGMQPAN